MQISIIQHGRVLRTICHEGQTYVETPTSGTYKLRVYNNCHRRRLAVISVDGVDICSGKDASYEGGGYCLSAWQTIDIPGFYRNNGTVAAFEFKEQGGSYAAQTGRGTRNVGVIGLAVFDEKVVRRVESPPVVIHEHHHHTHTYSDNTLYGCERGVKMGEPWTDVNDELSLGSVTCSTSEQAGTTQYSSNHINVMSGEEARAKRPEMYGKGCALRGGTRRHWKSKSAETKDVGTAYGRETHFATTEVNFTKATDEPSLVISLRYATRSRLASWGVPVDKPNTGPLAANPFPAESQGVPAPPGWRG